MKHSDPQARVLAAATRLVDNHVEIERLTAQIADAMTRCPKYDAPSGRNEDYDGGSPPCYLTDVETPATDEEAAIVGRPWRYDHVTPAEVLGETHGWCPACVEALNAVRARWLCKRRKGPRTRALKQAVLACREVEVRG